MEIMIVDPRRNRRELAELTALLETLALNEKKQTRAMERFIETLDGPGDAI
jgi:hypothetical protein